MSELADEQLIESNIVPEDDDVQEAEAAPVEEGAEAVEDAEVVVSIGDSSPDPEEEERAQAPVWVKELRKSHRDIQRENRELKERLAAKEAPAQQEVLTLGAEPTLDDVEYDPDRFKDEWTAWNNRKAQLERLNDERSKAAAAEAAQWQDKLKSYSDAKAKLKVADYDDAEHLLQGVLSPMQQGIIVQGADNPALVVYALGKNPAKAKELAAITDPVKYAFALAKLETQLKVTKRSAPTPDKPVSSKGGASYSGALDSTLERLRTEAERTGDYSKVHEYRRQHKSKG